LQEVVLIAAIVSANAILVLTLTVLLVRELNRRRALEQVLRQTLTYWRKAYEASVENRELDPDCPDDDGMPE
jgi:hypothetical protein